MYQIFGDSNKISTKAEKLNHYNSRHYGTLLYGACSTDYRQYCQILVLIRDGFDINHYLDRVNR